MFRLRSIFRRTAVENDLDDELWFHLEQEVEKSTASGLSRPEALRQAKLALGGLDQTNEECRDVRGVSLLETTLQDVRYALRGMRHNPVFTIIAVLTLAFGTAATATVFTLANTFFFRKLPVSQADRDRVAVISFNFWRSWFGSSPDILGSILKINGTVFTVVGVAPQTFRGITVKPDEIYIPTMMARAGYHWCEDSLAANCATFDMIGQLHDGYTEEQVRAEMITFMPAAWTNANEGENSGITVFTLKGTLDPDLTRSSERHFVKLLSCVAGVLLLVCCMNLAGLLIARNSARARELAIRASLGAARSRLIRQLITESLVLAIIGGLGGTVLSLALTGALNAMFYSADVEGHPVYYNFDLAPGVIFAVLLVSISAGCILGTVPACKSIRVETADGLKRQSGAVSAESRAGRGLAGVQTGIAVALALIA